MVKKGKKVVTPAAPKPSLDAGDLWRLANEIEQLACKMSNVESVAELLASQIVDMPESGAAWAIVDLAKNYTEELDELSQKCMGLYLAAKGIK